MFFLLVIIIIISLIFLVLLVSDLEINVEKIQLNTIKKPMIENILIYIKLKIFNKITFLKIKIDNKKIEKMKKSKFVNSKLLRKIIYKQKIIKIVKDLDINLEQINLKLVIGLIDTMATILSIPILSTIISIIIAKTTKEYKKEKCKYTIIPNYSKNLVIKIQLDCIISLKLVNIMNVIYILLKEGSEKNDERTSNRRAYGCSNG
jgi:hypothetical protein